MKIPDCYDPVNQAEALAMLEDAAEEGRPICAVCEERLYPGDRLCRRFIAGEEMVICRFCLRSMITDLEVVC